MRRLKKPLIYITLSLIAVSMLIPFLWMVRTALMDPAEVFSYPIKWLPRPPKWEHFKEACSAVPFGRFYLNSFLIAVCITGGQVMTSAMAAYAFSRLRFPGRDQIFFGYLATLMIPSAVTMIPLFVLLQKLHWINSYKAVVLPGIFSVYGTFLLRQFFMTIPKELEEAATIDGCSRWQIFWMIILPLSKPALATLTILTFMGSWRAFMWPLIVLHSPQKLTLPVGLAFFQSEFSSDWHLLMAGSIVMLIPIIVVFIIGQKFFTEGIQLGAIKG